MLMNNHPMRIEYEPEIMWFDYQALFDQTINTLIDGENIKVKIFCTCLENNNYYILDLVEYLSLIYNRKITNK